MEIDDSNNDEPSISQFPSFSPQFQLSVREFLKIITSRDERIGEDELERLLANTPPPVSDDGLEPSDRLTIFIDYISDQGVKKVKKINIKRPKSEDEELFFVFENENSNNNEPLILQSPSVPPQPQLSLRERFNILRSIAEECTKEDELERLLANKPNPICYDGFEPSGRMHIAQGVVKVINVKKMISAGCKVKIWIADLFAQMNNKMDGDLEKIKVVGKYFIELWKSLGVDTEGGQVEFIWASEEIDSRRKEYDELVDDISRRTTQNRVMKCVEIMGRSEKEKLSVAQLVYPIKQCADIFFLEVDICQMGMDQRKVNMLAREYCDQTERKNKPIILSHHMLPGLQEGKEKMSKSDPLSAIFMDDEEAEVNLKIKKAFCPAKLVEKNPCMEYIKHIVFPWFNEFKVERRPDNGGDKIFESFEDLAAEYEIGDVHPGDLKPALARALNQILQSVRDHFNTDPKAKELLEMVKSFEVTR